MNLKDWFDIVDLFEKQHDMAKLLAGIKEGFIDEQDDYGMTQLYLAVAAGWEDGVHELIAAGADTELRDHRTGSTPLYSAVTNQDEAMIAALLKGDANPDAPNHWGITPREHNVQRFALIPVRPTPLPKPRIQNAEHLADHHHPHFKIPSRDERESLRPGQAIALYVYGPKSQEKEDAIKVRITARSDEADGVVYTATVETPFERTHLMPGTTQLRFGPEHVATVFVQRAGKKKGSD